MMIFKGFALISNGRCKCREIQSLSMGSFLFLDERRNLTGKTKRKNISCFTG
jgi:hypothetical protein